MGKNIYTEEYVKNQDNGNWTVLEEVNLGEKHRSFKCVCVCGKEKTVLITHLRSKRSTGCGCIGNYKKTHELSNTTLYSVWLSMKQRCYNKNRPRYKDWGGRGIEVCEIWKKNFSCFYKWCLENGYNKRLQIDRIDNDGNYEPSNCRFITPKENSSNRRKRKPNGN